MGPVAASSPSRSGRWSLVGLWVGLSVSAGLAPGCTVNADPLARLDKRYTELAVRIAIADRDTARNIRNGEARRRLAEAEAARVAFFRDPEVIETIEKSRRAPEGSLERTKADAYWRQMIVTRAWTEEQKAEETRLIGRLEEARAQEASWMSPDGEVVIPLSGSWVEVSRAADDLSLELRRDLAREYVDQQMASVGADLLALVGLRNTVAQAAGYPNYWELSLASQGLDADDVDRIINDLQPIVQPVDAAVHDRLEAEAAALGLPLEFANVPLLRRRAGMEQGRDEADLRFDTDLAEERVRTAFQDMGISTRGWQVYSGPRRYTRAGVYGFAIRPPGNIAIVMSQDQRWSVWQYEALAHEGGHAVWWNNLPEAAVASPVLWDLPPPWSEGFAQFFERIVYEPEFSARYVPEMDPARARALANWRARHMAGWITDSIVQTLVERRLYEDPKDLQGIQRYAAEARAHLTGMPLPPTDGRGFVYDPALISSIVWLYPAYSQNYLFAYMTEAWMHDAVVGNVGPLIANEAVGPLILERIVHADPGIPFPDRLASLSKGDRTAPLRAYIQGPPAAEAAGAAGGDSD
ncbi:MAG: hypothetical protein D6798_20320 [Deltaproteobacteria bacterium]|nr:MAG: hypothetical protein D6798_20320 [Deltaproteobacteria bacterium]